LEDRTVVVTGAGRGLGITLASAVLDAGGDVVCLDVLPQPSEVEWSGITKIGEETGRHATYYQCDITTDEQVQATLAEALSQAEKRNKPIRGLISCAGVQQTVDAIDYPTDGFKRILDVNVTGSFLVAKHTARLMRDARNRGSIVFIASMSGQIANRVRSFHNLRGRR
jgi:NAD(P)-dependent dehydrogenase (short-subunit alcohol dehydrogenase family)